MLLAFMFLCILAKDPLSLLCFLVHFNRSICLNTVCIYFACKISRMVVFVDCQFGVSVFWICVCNRN